MITSIQNNQVKLWRKLHQRKHRQQTKSFLVEGFHIVEEAHKSNWDIVQIIVQEGVKAPDWVQNYEIIVVSDQVFHHMTYTQTPQGIAAIIHMKEFQEFYGQALLLIDAIQDPGNLGAIIRTADAVGMDGIILGNGTVDLFNDKVIRATQGSLFHLPIIQNDLGSEVSRLKALGYPIFASGLYNATNYLDLPKLKKYALIVGNEGAGVSDDLVNMADQLVSIPIYGKAESLNASVATGILLYELKKKLALHP